jgi:hypothetical protein
MQSKLYQPFQRMQFDNRHCFLSGDKLDGTHQVPVFAKWLQVEYHLAQMPFKMLDETMKSYGDLYLPCTIESQNSLQRLEETIQLAFEKGYDAVKELDPNLIFLWVAKTVYGVIFNEIQSAIKQQHTFAEGFNMSQGLIHKFSWLHQMLQQLIKPISLEDFTPYSIFICEVNNQENEFAYRDEINTLTLSLRMKNFGLLVNLQDNGANKIYHEAVWDKINSKTLHPIQFEELCAKIFYSAYLFNRLPEYHAIITDEEIFIETMPLRGMSGKPIFDQWQVKIYGQVVENFWKKWGFLLLEIIKNPEKPMSYLLDESENFVDADLIDLPV